MKVFLHSVLSMAAICLLPVLAIAQPDASFTVSRTKVCSGSTVYLTNQSTNATSFEWYVGNTFLSSAVDTAVQLFENCYKTEHIRLFAYDSSGNVDSMQKIVEVFDSCFFHYTVDILACPGDTIIRQTHPEATGQQWTVTPPHAYFLGCDTCDTIGFVLAHAGTMIDGNWKFEGGCSWIGSYHYMCSGTTTSVPENTDEEFKTYPNPADEFINLSGIKGDELFELMNPAGAVVREGRLNGRHLFTGDLSQGIYLMTVMRDNKPPMRTIFIKN